jgi:hypothetical protein
LQSEKHVVARRHAASEARYLYIFCLIEFRTTGGTRELLSKRKWARSDHTTGTSAALCEPKQQSTLSAFGFIHPSIHPSIHSSIHPSIHSSIHSSIHPSIQFKEKNKEIKEIFESMKFFSLILLLFSTVTSHGDSTKIDCPGVVVDGKTYIGVKNDLEPLSEFFQDPYTSFCEFTELDVNLRNPTVKIASTYSCDLGILGTCQGYLVNSNYVFWDQEGGRQFLDPPQHCHLITSCQQIQDVCDTTSDLSCDKGEYVCRPLHDKSSWCQGKVVSPTDPEPCPEKVTGKYCQYYCYGLDETTTACNMLGRIASHVHFFRLPRTKVKLRLYPQWRRQLLVL